MNKIELNTVIFQDLGKIVDVILKMRPSLELYDEFEVIMRRVGDNLVELNLK